MVSRSRLRAGLTVLLAMVVLAVLAPSRASAEILPAQVLDGPSASILDVDGTAMAPDGSGGIVYRKLVDGVAHVFVDQFVDGAWQPPVQADVGDSEPATMPAIAACDGGGLVVAWVEPWAGVVETAGDAPTLTYRLMASVLQPGASSFSQVEPIDTVGDGTAVDPELTMSPDCNTYVTYRVVTNTLTDPTEAAGTPSPTDPGDELVDVRVARLNGEYWSDLGAVNAYEDEVSDREPTTENEPQIATVSNSEAIVVWQEPDTTGYARIWARYIFGSTLGNAIQISPSTVDGQPVDVDADAPSVGLLGQATFRLAGGSGSPYGSATQILGLTVPAAGGSGADAAYSVDLGGGASVGEPDAGADIAGDFPVAAEEDGEAVLYSSLGKAGTVLGAVSGDGPVLTVPDPSGGWAAAWPSTTAGGLPDVEVTERYPDGSTQTGSLSAPLSGSVSDLSVGDSDLADALVGWMQGPADDEQVMGAVIAAPPEAFQYMQGTSVLATAQVKGPSGWVRPAKAKIEWAPGVDPVGSLTYEITVDGQVKARDLRGPSSLAPSLTLSATGTAWQLAEARSLAKKLPTKGLGTGTHKVRVYVTDQYGQKTELGSVKVRVDATAPTVKLIYLDHRRELRVRVTDKGSGVRRSSVRISFGAHIKLVERKDSVTHRYARAGRYTVTVTAHDKVGNRRHVRVVVRIR